jgi:hypothetical protein
VIDLTVPHEPRRVGTIPVGGYRVEDILAQDGIVYIAAGDVGLVLAWPQCGDAVPVRLASFTLTPTPGAVTLAWRIAGDDGHAPPAAGCELTAAMGAARWTVPHRRVDADCYAAHDGASRLAAGGAVTYSLFLVDIAGERSLVAREEVLVAPARPGIADVAISPNPANPATRISFALKRSERVAVAVYDLAGRRMALLADGVLSAGRHVLPWNGRGEDGREVASGSYLVRIVAESGVAARQLAIVR